MATKKKPAKKKAPKDKLTQNQEELAKAYILNHGNQTAAYRKVYPESKAIPETLWVLASKAFKPAKVQIRIQELQDMATERHLVTVDTLTEELEASYAMGQKNEQAVAMTGATMGKAKLHGFLTDKVEHSGAINLTKLSDEELEKIVKGD